MRKHILIHWPISYRWDIYNSILEKLAFNLWAAGSYLYRENFQFSLCNSFIFSGRTPGRIKRGFCNIKFCVLRSLRESRRTFLTSQFFYFDEKPSVFLFWFYNKLTPYNEVYVDSHFMMRVRSDLQLILSAILLVAVYVGPVCAALP